MAAAIQKYTLLISGALIITVSHHLLVIAAFAACMIIFVFPCFLLGTVTPSLVKYTVGSLEESGTTVGMLGAFNTIGSIIGTFLPTFVTIPAEGTAIDKKYDVIMVDAYQDITIPFQMSSAEFFRMVREHLNEDGVMVVNMNMRTDTEDGINTWLSDTIASVYPHVRTDPRQDRRL